MNGLREAAHRAGTEGDPAGIWGTLRDLGAPRLCFGTQDRQAAGRGGAERDLLRRRIKGGRKRTEVWGSFATEMCKPAARRQAGLKG